MTLEQLILSIRPSWDAACCLLIAPTSPSPPPFHKTTPPPHHPSVAGSHPCLSLCQYVLKDTHCTARVSQNVRKKRLKKKRENTQNNKTNRKNVSVRRAASGCPPERLKAHAGDGSQCCVLNASVFRLIPFDSSLERSGQRESTTRHSLV